MRIGRPTCPSCGQPGWYHGDREEFDCDCSDPEYRQFGEFIARFSAQNYYLACRLWQRKNPDSLYPRGGIRKS